MADGVRVEAEGLADLRAGAKQARQAFGKAQRRALKEVAVKVQPWLRAAASGGPGATRATARYAEAIQGRSTQKAAQVAIVARGRNRGAATAFYGAGEGPIAINDELARRADDLDRMIADAYEQAYRETFGG